MTFLGHMADRFRCAGRGVRLANRDRNVRLMFAAGVPVIGLAGALEVSATSWAVLLVCIALVVTAEVMNTALEALADRVEAGYDEAIRVVKDLAAGAVLIAAVLAAVVGIVVFWPYVT
jgi:diacylglycerol kinase (ATP)